MVQSLSHKGHHKHHADPDKARDPVLGDILVVVAQMAAALQFIIEEKYLAKYRVPALLGVGLEGMWGLLLSAIALPILSIVKGSDGMAIDSLVTAFKEIANSWQLQVRPVCMQDSCCGSHVHDDRLLPVHTCPAAEGRLVLYHELLSNNTDLSGLDLPFPCMQTVVLLLHLFKLRQHVYHSACFCMKLNLRVGFQTKSAYRAVACLTGVHSWQHCEHRLLQLLWLECDQEPEWWCQGCH